MKLEYDSLTKWLTTTLHTHFKWHRRKKKIQGNAVKCVLARKMTKWEHWWWWQRIEIIVIVLCSIFFYFYLMLFLFFSVHFPVEYLCKTNTGWFCFNITMALPDFQTKIPKINYYYFLNNLKCLRTTVYRSIIRFFPCIFRLVWIYLHLKSNIIRIFNNIRF